MGKIVLPGFCNKSNYVCTALCYTYIYDICLTICIGLWVTVVNT